MTRILGSSRIRSLNGSTLIITVLTVVMTVIPVVIITVVMTVIPVVISVQQELLRCLQAAAGEDQRASARIHISATKEQ